MENARNLILLSVSTIIFCCAVTLLFRQCSEYESILHNIKEKYQDEQELYIQTNQENEDLCTYDELIACLCGTIEYDMEIDGQLISKYGYNPADISSYHMKHCSYRKSYAYDCNGNVTRLIYRSVS